MPWNGIHSIDCWVLYPISNISILAFLCYSPFLWRMMIIIYYVSFACRIKQVQTEEANLLFNMYCWMVLLYNRMYNRRMWGVLGLGIKLKRSTLNICRYAPISISFTGWWEANKNEFNKRIYISRTNNIYYKFIRQWNRLAFIWADYCVQRYVRGTPNIMWFQT